MKAYLAAGWFTEEQEKARLQILKCIQESGIDYYSPKDHGIYVPGKTDPQEIFDENIRQIDSCSIVVASTVGKDMGTLFECGVAYSKNIPVIYPAWHIEGNFNLMLSQSALAVINSPKYLTLYLKRFMQGKTTYVPYEGDIE